MARKAAGSSPSKYPALNLKAVSIERRLKICEAQRGDIYHLGSYSE
jgi:hypothetical protein